MISVVITAYREPKTIGKAIEAILEQEVDVDFELFISAPDKETLQVAEIYELRDPRVRIFIDNDEGKSAALNQLLPELEGKILVLTDGDVFVGKNSLKEIVQPFKDKKVGCVTGRPVSVNSRNNMLGYWSHLLVDAGAHEARKKREKKGEFLECSGYFWAFKNGVIKNFPVDIAEDTVVPLLFRERGFKVRYAENAKVYVKFPTNLRDFIEQKKRTAKAHESLKKYVNVKRIPRTKTFMNEILEGWKALFYPKNIREIVWTLLLFPFRLYIWILVFYHTRIKKEHYGDAWDRIESTK
jgi:cellulose synthase/poly-beta-1,6-N-acetylglucosamine synthase-like glycosyltransferase